MNQTGLSREIGLLDATMIVVSGVIGGGIFFTPSAVAGHLPNPAWIIAVWLVGALIAYAGALTFAELVTRFPQAGGHYVYIRQGFGPLWAFLYGWMLLLIIATGALASLALAFGGYLAAFFPLSVAAQKFVGVLIIIGFSALNILGVKPGARTTTLLTIIKVAAIALMIGLGLFMEPRTPPTATIDMPATGTMLLGFGAALVPVLFSYGGWQQLNFLAGEVRSPERRVPLALALGVSIVAVVYVGMNMVYLRALGPAGMAASTALARDAGVVLFGDFASRAITALVAISILAFSNVVIMATPRVFYALAQDGVFLRGLSVLHPRFRTPARAIVLQGIWAIVLVLIGNIGVLVNGVVFADWIFFGLGAASIFVIRRRDTTPPAYRVPGYPFVPAFFVLAALVAVGSAIIAYPKESSLGVGMMAIGAGLYNVFKRRSA